MVKRIAVLVAAAVAGLMTAGLAGAQSNVQRVEIDSFLFNSCTNELVSVSGTLQMVSQSFVLPNGRRHTILNMTEHYDGVGQITGDLYRFNVTTNLQRNLEADFDGEQTVVSQFRGVGRGGVLDLTRHATVHLTTVDGETVADVRNIWFSCR